MDRGAAVNARRIQLEDRISSLRAEIMSLTAPGTPYGLSGKDCKAAVKALSEAQRALRKTLQKEPTP